MKWTEKLSSKDCEGYVSKRRDNTASKTLSCKTTKMQSFVNKITGILASLQNNQSFYYIADFFVCLFVLHLEKRKRGKLQRVVAPDRTRMISVQDSAGCLRCGACETVNLLLPLLVILLFLPPLVT